MDMKKFTDHYAAYETQKGQPSMIGTSFIMGILAMALAYILGLPFGVLMARNKDKFADKLAWCTSSSSSPCPHSRTSISSAISAQRSSICRRIFTTYGPGDVRPWILPIISLALPSIESLMLWTRRSCVDQMTPL